MHTVFFIISLNVFSEVAHNLITEMSVVFRLTVAKNSIQRKQ